MVGRAGLLESFYKEALEWQRSNVAAKCPFTLLLILLQGMPCPILGPWVWQDLTVPFITLGTGNVNQNIRHFRSHKLLQGQAYRLG